MYTSKDFGVKGGLPVRTILEITDFGTVFCVKDLTNTEYVQVFAGKSINEYVWYMMIKLTNLFLIFGVFKIYFNPEHPVTSSFCIRIFLDLIFFFRFFPIIKLLRFLFWPHEMQIFLLWMIYNSL